MRIDKDKEDDKSFAEQELHVDSPATSYSIFPLSLNREYLQWGSSKAQRIANFGAHVIIQGYGEASFQ